MKTIAQERAEDQRVLRLFMAMPDAVGQQLHEMVVSAGLEAVTHQRRRDDGADRRSENAGLMEVRDGGAEDSG